MPGRDILEDWEEIAADFGHRVRALRLARGMTQEQLGHAVSLSRNQVQNIESSRNNSRDADGRRVGGTANPRLETVYALARVLGVEVTELMRH
ncbi:helix-turn-helix transcriptional regulator [Nocardioides nitrophenolicus]|uniref:helix-turn-helix transcriptional regulator n=1 Tax=Nocardioides nitrophenolicus TaxID=60489 RepID=UPI001959EB2F|nr:helix-turn-helix transcriptional regulator [Nocardioides nitrophenolicus]MBM7515295.1 transcriptional regulator with XRE-family HTH domain [Nocardioides nitrophenolicus]